MKYKLIAIIIFLALCCSLLQAQDTFPNTLTLDAGSQSPEATLSDIAWIQGHWRGKAFGGITEEVWTPPLGGSMMCVFKLVVDNRVQFYEIVTITEEENSLMLQLKHFHEDLKGWEEKDETVDFPLVKVTPNKVFFDGFTFDKVSEDEMNIYVITEDKEGKQEVKFNYKRVAMEHHQTIKTYYRSYKKANKETLRSILTDDFLHISSFRTFTNRDEMIEEIWPEVGKSWAENLQIFGTHPEYLVRYKVVGGDEPSRNMAEYIRFENDKIAEIEVFTGRELE